jgi:hypothetical protein
VVVGPHALVFASFRIMERLDKTVDLGAHDAEKTHRLFPLGRKRVNRTGLHNMQLTGAKNVPSTGIFHCQLARENDEGLITSMVYMPRRLVFGTRVENPIPYDKSIHWKSQ